MWFPTSFRVRFRAVNGSRTRDLQLGKLPLYQLSYYRIGFLNTLKNRRQKYYFFGYV